MSKQQSQHYTYTPKYKRDDKKSQNQQNQSNGNSGPKPPQEYRNAERRDNMKYRTETINMNDTEKELFNNYKVQKKNVIESFENDYKAALYGSLITTRKIYVEQYNSSLDAQKQQPISQVVEE